MLRISTLLAAAVLLTTPVAAQSPDDDSTLENRLPDKLNLAWADPAARRSGPRYESGGVPEESAPLLALTAARGSVGGASFGAAASGEEAPEDSATDDDNADEPAADDPDRWKITLAPYLWAASLTGNATVKGIRASGTQTFSEIVDNLDLGVMGRIKVEKGKFGFMFDGLFMELSDGVSAGPIDVDARLQMLVFEWDATYRVYQLDLEEHIEDSSIEFRAFVGNRYFRLDGRINPSPSLLPTVDDTQDWIDIIIGTQVHWTLPKNFWFRMKADIGGFGIGGSHFTWNLEPLLGYSFKNGMFATAGYRVLDVNYSDSHGSEKFALDARFYGPMLGFGYTF